MSETYTTGGDSGYPPTSPKLVGQTFTPLIEHKLEFIDLNISRFTVGGELVISVHDLETDPNMTGYGISRAHQDKFERANWWDFQRTRVSMPKVTLHKDHAYGFCVTNHPVPWWNKFYVKYDLHDATYPRGKRFTKDNRADPPTYYDDSDLIFTEFGRPVAPPTPPNPDPDPPPTPPDPPINKWLIIQQAQERTLTGEKIIAYTNVPCHLWMRWTLVPPRIHKIPITRRGLTTMSDFYYCFDVYHDNEQEEAGDTLIHTFIKEPWPYCETRYFYFHGQVDGLNSPSTSAIFTKHPIEPTYGVIFTGPRATDFPCPTPDPLVGERVPDDDLTYFEYAPDTAGWTGYCTEKSVGEDYPLSKVEVLSRARQLPGTTRLIRYFSVGLEHYPTNTYYGPTDQIIATNEYQTITTTFLTNPRTGNPWTRRALDFFNIVYRHTYYLSEHYIYGPTRHTWLQTRIYR